MAAGVITATAVSSFTKINEPSRGTGVEVEGDSELVKELKKKVGVRFPKNGIVQPENNFQE